MQIGPFPPNDVHKHDKLTADWLNKVKDAAFDGILPEYGFIGAAGAVFGNRPQVKPVGFINQSGESIPPGSVLRATGFSRRTNGQTVITVAKPNTYGSQDMHFISNWCGPTIADGKYGTCQDISQPMLAAYASGDGTPAFGQRWGPRNNVWNLKKSTLGWRVIGLQSIPTGDTPLTFAVVIREPMWWFRGQPTGDVAAGASGTVTIFYNGTTTSVTMANVLNDSSCTVKGSQNCRVLYNNDAEESSPWQFTDAHTS